MTFSYGKNGGCSSNPYVGLLEVRSTPHPVTVTSRIITFLVGNPNLNLHLPLASWVGGRSKLEGILSILSNMFIPPGNSAGGPFGMVSSHDPFWKGCW